MTDSDDDGDRNNQLRVTLERSYDWIVKRDRLIQLWAWASSWTLEEGIALAYNLDPHKAIRTVDTAFGTMALFVPDPGSHHLELAKRALWDGHLTSPVTPSKFISWAERIGLKFDDAWLETISTASLTAELYSPKDAALSGATGVEGMLESNDALSDAESSDLNPKARTSLLKLVIGMAVGGYGYNPGQRRSDVTKEIADDLETLGLALDRDTILRWLRESAELLPGDALEQDARVPKKLD